MSKENPAPWRHPCYIACMLTAVLATGAVLLLLLGPLLYVVQLRRKRLTVPWYAPALASVSVLLLLVALFLTPEAWVVAAVAACAGIAGLEWYFLLRFTRLPRYAGPVR